MKKLVEIIATLLILIILTSCQQNWQSTTTNTKLENDKKYCKATANATTPIYICENPLMCKPKESSLVFETLAKNKGTFNKCMYDKGYYTD